MSDLLFQIREIRSRLASGTLAKDDRLVAAARAYGDACREANARLARCTELIARGLRSEALQLARVEPDLLDLVAALDFRGSDAWPKVAAKHGLPGAPGVLVRDAEILNRAFAEEQPVEELLKRHRTLALARAPLVERLAVLRQLAAADRANPVWAEDVPRFEAVRFGQMQAELRAARQKGDHDTVRRLAVELGGTRWLEPIPIDLADEVDQAAGQAEREHASDLLADVEGMLHRAINSNDVATTRRLRERAEELLPRAGLEPSHPLARRVGHLLNWIDLQAMEAVRQQDVVAASDRLESLLHAGAPEADLTTAYGQVREVTDAVPRELEAAYRGRLADLERGRRRTRVVRLTAAGGVVCVMLAAGGVWLAESARAREVEESVRTLREALDRRDLAAARAFFRELQLRRPSVADRAELRALGGQLERAELEDRRRADEFQRVLVEAMRQPEEVRPDAPVFVQLLKLSRTPVEREASARAVSEKAQTYRRACERKEAEVGAAVAELKRQLEALGVVAAEPAALQAGRAVLKRIGDGLQATRKEREFLSEDLRGRIARLEADLAESGKQFAERQREVDGMHLITAGLIGDRDNFAEYVGALRAYGEAFPDTPRSRAFLLVSKEREGWEAIVAWNRFIAAAGGEFFPDDPDAARMQIARWDELLKRSPHLFSAKGGLIPGELLEAYRGGLEAAMDRAPAGGKLVAELKELFARRDLNGLWFVKGADDKVYYVAEDPDDEIRKARAQGSAGRARFLYLVDGEGRKATKLFKPGDIRGHGVAPQTTVREQCLRELQFLTPGKWDRTVVALLEHVLSAREMDPVLQTILVKRLADIGGRGDPFLGAALAGHEKAVAAAKLDLSVPWLNPERDDAADVRKSAAAVIQSLPPIRGIREDAANRRREIAERLAQTRRVPVGWLLEERENQWRCVTANAPAAGQRLFVYSPSHDMQEMRGNWVQLGQWNNGKAVFNATASKHLLEGRLVFAELP